MSHDEVEWIYNALDCCVTHEIFSEQEAVLDSAARKTETFSYQLMAPIMEMSLRGVAIDEAARQDVLKAYRKEHVRVEQNLKRIVEEGVGFQPGKFNYKSTKQLLTLFYGVLQLKEVKSRSASGKWTATVDRNAMEKLQLNLIACTFCKHIITLRELDKKINFLATPRDDDGRLRSNYNIAGTNTGRLSSSVSDFGTGTNQQNISHKQREIFIPDPGMKFCNVDLEQADARNVGAICWNTFVESHGEAFAGSYLDACESGDLHTTVCRMARPDLEWPKAPADWRAIADEIAYREMSYRDLAKRLGHGTNYFGTPRTMAAHTKVATPIITAFQESYFKAFPVIGDPKHTPPHWNGDKYEYENWHQYVRYCLETFGSITTTHYNRRRFFYGRPNEQTTLREAIAYEPQSMTADAIDQGIINLWRWNHVQLLIQVHDSILFQYPEDREAEIIPHALELLTIQFDLKNGRPFSIPVEAKIGWNWNDFDEDENPSGLAKWRGPEQDTRTRPKVKKPKYFSLNEELSK